MLSSVQLLLHVSVDTVPAAAARSGMRGKNKSSKTIELSWPNIAHSSALFPAQRSEIPTPFFAYHHFWSGMWTMEQAWLTTNIVTKSSFSIYGPLPF